jgi:hypothetical protein
VKHSKLLFIILSLYLAGCGASGDKAGSNNSSATGNTKSSNQSLTSSVSSVSSLSSTVSVSMSSMMSSKTSSTSSSAMSSLSSMSSKSSSSQSSKSSSSSSKSSSSSGPVTIADCADTLSKAKIGVWEDITPEEFKLPDNVEIWNIAVSKVDSALYAIASNGTNGGGGTSAGPDTQSTGIYKSTDCGATFTKVSTGEGHGWLERGTAFGLGVDPENPDIIYEASGYGNPSHLFRSVNGGKDWVDLFLHPEFSHFPYGAFIRSFQIDPRDTAHILVNFHEACFDGVLQSQGGWGKAFTDDPGLEWECKDPDADGNCTNPATRKACNGKCQNQGVNCLAESKDRGDSWRLFKGPEPFLNADGGMIGFMPPRDAASNSAWLIANPGSVVWYSGDEGVTWQKTNVPSGNAINSPIAASDGNFYLPSEAGVFMADKSIAPLGVRWTPMPHGPKSNVLTEDGKRLYSSWQPAQAGEDWLFSTSLNDLNNWILERPPIEMKRGGFLVTDKKHKVIYSSNGSSGLWRLVTE